MDQTVLVHADIDKRAERGDVGHHAFQLHPHAQVGEFFNAIGEACGLELGTGVAAGLLDASTRGVLGSALLEAFAALGGTPPFGASLRET